MAKVLDGGSSPESWPDVPESGNVSGAGDSPTQACCEQTKCFCHDYQQQEFLQRLQEYADVTFRWRTFWKELVYHVFFPLSLPLIYAWEGGYCGIVNRQFWGSIFLPISQWFFGLAFISLNGLTPLYFSPDIFVVDFLWIVRCLIVATKYGFTSDGEMHIMRTEVLPFEAHTERTLVLAWSRSIPLRVLKRQLLLAAVRKNFLRLHSALRLVPGASGKTIHEIMQQLTDVPKDRVQLSVKPLRSWDSLDRAIGFSEKSQLCATCLEYGRSNKSFEKLWLEICMSDIHKDPRLIIPTEEFLAETEVTTVGADGHEHGRRCPALDLPALLLAAYILQRASDLLPTKKVLHQLFTTPWRIYWASQVIGIIHAIIPFAIRALVGEPLTFGGTRWYHYVVSVNSFLISYTSMSASVMFMLGGLADFRRRYFVARLLNTLLKDGCAGDDTSVPNGYHKLWDYKGSSKEKCPYHLGLAINFTDPRSILGWWSVRCLVQDFGLVFYMRVKYYASFFAMYCGFLMAYLVVKLFATNARRSSYILALVVFDLLVFVSLLCLVVSPGGDTNKMNIEHGATISRVKMAMSTKLDQRGREFKPEERTRLEISVEVLESISEAIYWDNSINQVTILGFKAGGEVLGVLIGAGSTAVGIAAQQLTATIS